MCPLLSSLVCVAESDDYEDVDIETIRSSADAVAVPEPAAAAVAEPPPVAAAPAPVSA